MQTIGQAADTLTFAAAEAIAERIPDIMEFHRWLRHQELRYERLPSWFWNETKRRQVYVGYVHRAYAWYEKQAGIAKAQADNFPIKI